MGGDLGGDLVALQDVLERLDPDAVPLGQPQEHQDLVAPVAVAVDLDRAVEDPGQGLEPEVAARRGPAASSSVGLRGLVGLPGGPDRPRPPRRRARWSASTPIRVLGNRPRSRVTFSPRANLTPCGPSWRIRSRPGLAVAELDDGVLAADRVGRAVQEPGGGRPAGQGPIDRRVVARDHVLDPDLGDDREAHLVDAPLDRHVRMGVDDPGHRHQAGRVDDRRPLRGRSRSGPTAAILPSRTRIEPLGIVPWVTVRIVASLIRTLPPVWIFGLAVLVELGRDVDERRRGRLVLGHRRRGRRPVGAVGLGRGWRRAAGLGRAAWPAGRALGVSWAGSAWVAWASARRVGLRLALAGRSAGRPSSVEVELQAVGQDVADLRRLRRRRGRTGRRGGRACPARSCRAGRRGRRSRRRGGSGRRRPPRAAGRRRSPCGPGRGRSRAWRGRRWRRRTGPRPCAGAARCRPAPSSGPRGRPGPCSGSSRSPVALAILGLGRDLGLVGEVEPEDDRDVLGLEPVGDLARLAAADDDGAWCRTPRPGRAPGGSRRGCWPPTRPGAAFVRAAWSASRAGSNGGPRPSLRLVVGARPRGRARRRASPGGGGRRRPSAPADTARPPGRPGPPGGSGRLAGE